MTASAHCAMCLEEHRDRLGESAVVLRLIFHHFETLDSLRTEVEALTLDIAKLDADYRYREMHDRLTEEIGQLSDIIRDISRVVGHVGGSAALVQTVAALTAERDELRQKFAAAENVHAVIDAIVVNLREEIATLRQLVLTDEALAEIVEPLAAIAHSQWSGWMQHMFGRLGYRSDTDSEPRMISDGDHRRWQRQSALSYAELPESEKESDRAEARKYIDAIRDARGVKEGS